MEMFSGELNSLLMGSHDPMIVVWHLTDLSDFSDITDAIVKTASGPAVRYIHFVKSGDITGRTMDAPKIAASVAEGDKGGSGPVIRRDSVMLSREFEAFTRNVCRIINESEDDTFFVFDSLSLLQTAWATDLMMINFLLVVTPLLRRKRAKAFLPLVRGRHAQGALQIVKDHADVYINVWSDFAHIYLRPDKIFDETEGEAFEPQLFDGRFSVITDGVLLSRFHRASDSGLRGRTALDMDSWDRFFDNVQRKFEYGEDVLEECGRMCRIMMSRDERMRVLIRKYFNPEDYFFVKEHMIGTGLIGGKACGMLVARKMIERERPDLFEYLESHDSFYIGSDVYYTFLVENGFWDLRVRQRDETAPEEQYFELGRQLEAELRKGVFSPQIERQLIRLLDYYGRSPIIVRSSSILEDGFEHAFAGKYESVFCPNTGSDEDRLYELEEAIRIVYASSMNVSALDYRKRRGLDKKDEQMAILVQRVSGSRYGDFFMPCAAGVGYSCAPYRFLETLDPAAGMLRLVMGLGTSAVDRLEGSYPRLVSLDRPEATVYSSSADRHKYAQRKLELIHLKERSLKLLSEEKVRSVLPAYLIRRLYEHDTDAERMLSERGINRDVTFVSCRGLVSDKELMSAMQGILRQLQDGYEYPVDIEFTINFAQNGDFVINLLQCRPLLVFDPSGENAQGQLASVLPQGDKTEHILFDCSHASMGLSRLLGLDYIIYIDPIAYYQLPYADKPQVASILGKINWYFRGQGRHLMLLTPGRICTSSPELGVPAAFADISECTAICELSESRAGYQPELSYGSHIFQDLVEAEILYVAVFENNKTKVFDPELLKTLPEVPLDRFMKADEIPGKESAAAVHVYDASGMQLYHDMSGERTICVRKA